MKYLLIVFAAFLSLSPLGSALAEETDPDPFALENFSATAAIASDYPFRGISQTEEDPAVQASFDYAHPMGLYLGVWGSNVDESISEGNVELDLYGGYTKEIIPNLTYDLSVIYYWYPGDNRDPEVDFWEGHAGLAYAFASVPLEPVLGMGYSYSPDFYGEDGDGHFLNGTLDLSLPLGFGLGLELGYQDVEGDKLTGNNQGEDGKDGFDYYFWRIGLAREIKGFELSVNYWDTDEEDFLGDIADKRVVFAISRSF
jgi:uncharacterized protein (TIGR02001 family)